MRRTVPLLLVLATSAAACSGGDDAAPVTTAPVGSTAPTAAPAATTVPATASPAPTTAAAEPATFDVRPGTEQVTITGAGPGAALEVVARDGEVLAVGTADDQGAFVARRLPGGEIVAVRSGGQVSTEVKVMARGDALPPSFYAEQRLPTEGLGYIETRDGTLLSASVWLPGPADAGPYPTVVEYSGYSPSDPDSQGFPDVLNGLGYAYVGVNIRGTGCSGGSFRYFEYAQSTDGYDVIEAVAAQPWVQGNRVGMVGVSYPGISQLFVAQTQPPSLAAITPFSVIADSTISTLYPGGILNTGFAVPWIGQRLEESQAFGQAWTQARADAGDGTCEANQALRSQNPDLLAELRANPYWTDALAADLAPRLFVDRITVPTFVAGAWQDEQTGGHFATMLDRFTGTDHLYASLVNGLHTESISPSVFPRWVEFLGLYVAQRVPNLAAARTIAPQLGAAIFRTDEVALPADDRFAGMTYEEALAAFEAEPPIEVLFEQGAAEGFPDRAPMARWVEAFDAWPVPGAVATRWSLGGDGTLAAEGAPVDGMPVSYTADPGAAPATFYEGSSDGIWSVDVEYDWRAGATGTFAAFDTEPLASDTVVVGSGSVDLWIESSAGDTDVEVTISEVRPDGRETYVQSGWLRASHRALDPSGSTELRPVHTHLEADAAPLPDGTPELVRVELFPFAHAFRAGSRIRLAVDAPGGNRPVWEFETISDGETVTIASGTLVLPVVPGIAVPAGYPACGALRGQPCR